ncbi:MAG: HAD family hydrolase [Caldiserica bacterium]|nr:HAD family hydrolase [Caldisericota bacterium]
MEVVNPGIARGRIRHALFDFDGTISLIRAGWQGVMAPLMVEALRDTPKGRELGEAELERLVRDYIAESTGIQTIHQMIWLAERVAEFGGTPRDPREYKRIYNERLLAHIAGRLSSLREGRAAPEEFTVPGARELLEALRARGVRCYLASGTDEIYVREEAELLGVAGYFSGIYGAQEDWKRFSKRMVIERILREHGLSGEEFVAFGDGFVEIQEAKAVGGIAVGVASDEGNPGRLDPWKRERLVRAGADLVVPDFRDHEALVGYLFAEGPWGER